MRWSTLTPTDGWFLIKSRGAFFTGYLSYLGQPLVKDWNAWHGQASTGCRVQWGNTKLSKSQTGAEQAFGLGNKGGCGGTDSTGIHHKMKITIVYTTLCVYCRS